MNTIQRNMINASAVVMLLGLSACSGISQKDKNTAYGAGAGGVAGAVITGGSALGTAGGAVVGGAIGRVLTDDDDDDDE